MSGTQELVLARAAEAFARGDYEQARQCYEQASMRFGGDLFSQSITLCNRRLQRRKAGEDVYADNPLAGGHHPGGPGEATAEGPLARQLQETQALLEKYYALSQELEHKLQDLEEEQGT